MKHIPLCWKCKDKILEWQCEGVTQYSTFAGCLANKKIITYEDAEKLCPILSKQ